MNNKTEVIETAFGTLNVEQADVQVDMYVVRIDGIPEPVFDGNESDLAEFVRALNEIPDALENFQRGPILNFLTKWGATIAILFIISVILYIYL